MITMGSVCSGVGGAELAFDGLAESVFMSEIETFPCAVLKYRFPQCNLVGDFTHLIENPIPCGVLVGGTPCFPAGTIIATKRGFLPIEQVIVGDEVITHTGVFKKVLRRGTRLAPTIRLKGQGHPCMVTTEEHPFLSKRREAKSTRIQNKPVRLAWWSKTEWTPSKDMVGRHWAYPTIWPSLPIPPIINYGNEIVNAKIDENLMVLAGMYVGDGWVRIDKRRGSILLGINEKKAIVAREAARLCGLNTTESQERTVIKLTIHGRAIARWMKDNFGSGAENKNLPLWLLGASRRLKEAFVKGYRTTDGSAGSQNWEAMVGLTVSKQLAFNMRSLGISLGYSVSVQYHEPPPTKVIEGRTVNQKPQWIFTYSNSTRSSVEKEGYRWQLVRSKIKTEKIEHVYNIEVEEDHSYLADGIVVHNCQAFSIAGKRLSLDDARGNLSLGFAMLLNSIDSINKLLGEPPCICLWENVPGLLSVDDNAFGCFLGALVGYDDAIINPRKRGRWPSAGVVIGPKRRAAWRILDAQHFNLAQRRKRVFVVASAREGFDPSAVLFEPKSVSGNFEKSQEAEQDTSRTVRTSASVGSELAATLGTKRRQRLDGETYLPVALTSFAKYENTLPTIRARGGDCGGGSEAIVPLAYGGGNQSGPIDVATTTTAHERWDFESETFVVHEPTISFNWQSGGDCRLEPREEQANTLQKNQAQAVKTEYGVRRLTPVECERLQGFPDNFTLIPNCSKTKLEDDYLEWIRKYLPELTREETERMAKDGNRYKACGNAFAVPVVRWIAKRLVKEIERIAA